MSDGTWVTRGFADFRAGTFGNGGQNLYVSRAGTLQRIHQFDLNQDGHFDLVFCNSQGHGEAVPAYVFPNLFDRGADQRLEIPARGARGGTVADLTGNGCDDLVLANHADGVNTVGLNSFVYFGSADGWGERLHQRLPTPNCTAVAAGDFNGDGRPDLAFLCAGRLRVFYQSELGFEPKRYVDLPIVADQIAAGDLDGDGCAELVTRALDGSVSVFWGGHDGILPGRSLALAGPASERGDAGTEQDVEIVEWVPEREPLVCVVELPTPHVFVARRDHAELVPVLPGRRTATPLVLACAEPMAVACGDVDGDGCPDLVVACREAGEQRERSWVYWGAEDGFSESRRTPLPSFRACDVAVADLDGDGCAEVMLCQGKTDEAFTTESLVYRGSTGRTFTDPLRLVSHDARRVFAAHPDGGSTPAVVLVNHFARGCVDNVKTTIYWGGADGYTPERRLDVDGSGSVEALGCDLTDDGRPDLILCSASEYSRRHEDRGSFIYLNGPDGFSATPNIVLSTIHAHGCCCGDLCHDGYLDLVFAGFGESEILVFHGGPDGFDTGDPVRIPMVFDGVVYKDPRWLCLADLNGDGWLDLIVPQITFDRSFILWGGPEGFSTERCQMLSVHHACCARVADLTGNGYLDLLIGGHRETGGAPDDSFVYVYWNGPDGLREDRRQLLPAKAVNSMAIADLNNDGLLDLFVGSYATERERDVDSTIYWNRAGRGFSERDRTRLFTHSASGCVAADFNGDGWIDLAVANHKVWGDHVGYSEVWWNGPQGFDSKRTTRLPTSGPHGMCAVPAGNIADRGPEEFYVSTPFALPEGTRAQAITWEAETPPRTWVKAQLRFAACERELADAPWIGPAEPADWFANGEEMRGDAPVGGWVQYRLALGAEYGIGTPRVTEVTVRYGRAAPVAPRSG